MVGLVSEPVELACGNRLRILFLLALLHCFGGLFDFVLLVLFHFILLLSLIFSLRRSTRSAVLRTRDGDSFGFEHLFDLGQLFDEGGELFNVERDTLGKTEDQYVVRLRRDI
jgi:hypothetical protein